MGERGFLCDVDFRMCDGILWRIIEEVSSRLRGSRVASSIGSLVLLVESLWVGWHSLIKIMIVLVRMMRLIKPELWKNKEFQPWLKRVTDRRWFWSFSLLSLAFGKEFLSIRRVRTPKFSEFVVSALLCSFGDIFMNVSMLHYINGSNTFWVKESLRRWVSLLSRYGICSCLFRRAPRTVTRLDKLLLINWVYFAMRGLEEVNFSAPAKSIRVIFEYFSSFVFLFIF